MLKRHPHICLFKPEIPQNTGNIARLAAATQCRLHLIKPFGFDASDKQLRRAGLDYWPFLDLEIHEDFEDMLSAMTTGTASPKLAFLSTKGIKDYTHIPVDTDILVFGQETKGLPKDFYEIYKEDLYTIPIFHPQVRSLNLANAVSIVLYDQISRRSGCTSERSGLQDLLL